MKRLIFAIVFLFLAGCSALKVDEVAVFGSSMRNSYTMEITKLQLDSICNADTLPVVERWASARFTDYETNKSYIKRMCRKSVGGIEYMYILTEDGRKYKITRRITD